MSDRTIFRTYDEDWNGEPVEEGWHTTLLIDRMASGPPGIMIRVEDWDGGLKCAETTVSTTRTQDLIDTLQEWVNRG